MFSICAQKLHDRAARERSRMNGRAAIINNFRSIDLDCSETNRFYRFCKFAFAIIT